MQCKVPQMALNLPEKVKLQRFLAEHQVYCPQIKNSCKYTISFEGGSGIGISVLVKCGFCGKRHDITDYGAW